MRRLPRRGGKPAGAPGRDGASLGGVPNTEKNNGGVADADSARLPHTIEPPVEGRESDLDLKTQIIRFLVTGVFSAIVDFGTYVLMMVGLGVPRDVAKSISFILGTTTAYLINRRWTFRAEPSRARFIAVVVLYGATFALQVGINRLITDATPYQDPFPVGAFWTTLAFVVAQGTATVVNFVVQRALIFRL